MQDRRNHARALNVRPDMRLYLRVPGSHVIHVVAPSHTTLALASLGFSAGAISSIGHLPLGDYELARWL